MIRTLLLLISLVVAPWADAAADATPSTRRIAADELIAVALADLQSRATAEGIAAQFKAVGHVDGVTVIAAGEIELEVDLTGAWLRPRVGVPVRIKSGGTKVSSVTLWFAVTAMSEGNVYAADYPRGASQAGLQLRTDKIDLARTHGRDSLVSGAGGEMRLVRAVRAGQPVLAADFEPTPLVSAQQDISIETGNGRVRLVTKGRALGDGSLGQLISVLAAGATQPVRARVVSDKVVTVEN